MKTEFTKGEWIIKHDFNIMTKDGRSIASAGTHSSNVSPDKIRQENLANAKLIAAAPDLLEALNEAVEKQESLITAINADADWFNNNMPHVGQTIPYKEKAIVPDWLPKAKAAIKKATE